MDSIYNLEREILPVLNNPKSLEVFIKEHISKIRRANPNLLNSLIHYDLKNLTRRNNTGQLVNYLFKQEKDNKPKPILKHNLKSRTTKGWTKELIRILN